jgi:hypothetical protein
MFSRAFHMFSVRATNISKGCLIRYLTGVSFQKDKKDTKYAFRELNPFSSSSRFNFGDGKDKSSYSMQ